MTRRVVLIGVDVKVVTYLLMLVIGTVVGLEGYEDAAIRKQWFSLIDAYWTLGENGTLCK